MKVSGFEAQGDIVGRRTRIRWDFIPEGSETLADVPPLTLCRKLRDYTFPGVSQRQPYVLYDTAAFPPSPVLGALGVTDLPSWEVTENGARTVWEPISVAVPFNGGNVEIFRRTVATVYGPDGVAVKQSVEIVDAGSHPGALMSNTVYYYQLFGDSLPPSGNDAAPYRGSAMVTDGYGLNQTLYQSLPEIYRRHDVSMRPVSPGVGSVPEFAQGSAGQLRRFLDPFGLALDSMRGTAEGLRTLQDIDATDARYLDLLARWIGWDFGAGTEIPVQRNELKNASRLYRAVGSLPGLRALVAQYTGWSTQVAEFAQNLALSNRPPQRNLFAITPDNSGSGWHGAEDAAELLGFAAGNQQSDASGVLTSGAGEPYALRPATELTIRADGLPGTAVRFQQGDDFVDIGAAKAAEVAAVINRELPEVEASDSSGHVVLRSKTVGDGSNVQVVPASSSLVSLENAPGGRLSTLTDSLGHIRLFYEAWETPTPADIKSPSVGGSTGEAAGNQVRRRVHYKSFAYGAWRDSHPLVLPEAGAPQADPAAVALADGRILVCWIDNPQSGASRLRYAIGKVRPPQPARLTAFPRGPLALTAGNGMSVVGNWVGSDRFTIRAEDFANPASANADELVAAMNRQLQHATVSRDKDGSIRIDSRAAGVGAKIAIDLRASNTARAVGFDRRSAIGVPGSWSEEIDWSGPFDVDSVEAGNHAETAAMIDPAGGVRLAWASHVGGRWRIQTAHWDARVVVGTADGLFVRDGANAWTKVVVGMPSDDIRAVAVDADGTIWIATANGVALRRRNGTVTTLAPALPSSDIRQIVFGADGTAWFATAVGIVQRAPDGTIVTISQGLPSADIRAIAVRPDGTLWAATAAGAVVRGAGGDINVIGASSGLPSLVMRDVAVDADGTVYLATAAGLAIKRSPVFDGGSFDIVNAQNGLRSADVRAVRLGSDGSLWVATDRGVSKRSTGGVWTTFDTLQGLASNDVQSLSISSLGTVWAIGQAGASVIARDASISNIHLISGAADPVIRSVHAGWSAPRELANGGGSNREPALSVDENNRTWLLWSQQSSDGNDNWTLHSLIQDPAILAWGADTPLTTAVVGKRSSDRTASAMQRPGGMRIYFGSDRNGGSGLWMADVSLAGAIASLVSIGNHASSELAPAPIDVGGAVWLFYRSDRNIPLAQVGGTPGGRNQASAKVSDIGSLRRFAGSLAVDLSDVERLRTRRSFGDLQSYTPNRPDGAGTLAEDELYTRGTVAFYVSAGKRGSPLTQHEVGRLRELLAQFTPANLRALVIVVILDDVEFVYGAGVDIGERYQDRYPFSDTLGPPSEATSVSIAGLTIIKSNQVDNVSANPANLSTLRRRSFFPPLQ